MNPYLSASYNLQIGLLNQIGFHERCNFIAQYLNSLTRGFTTCLAYKVYMTTDREKFRYLLKLRIRGKCYDLSYKIPFFCNGHYLQSR